ncbi:nuclear transport factor 2 family protein [Agromyces protaetiae]|uniref:Nuclear transport factor 2 family protein n=1 Tax=Agromyces protaetiae TaxID=2509455 RepID=A0A4P6FBL0_9MICO|nr:nuclear transport factor 2 family protein [Agromyces protaetiae]QAY73660.1 nuclear transport factor 2 family protein [Agromyces protaetiae]
MTDTFTEYAPGMLPAPVLAYLDARDASRYSDATALFAADAVVFDDGKTYEGGDAIDAWIRESSTEYTYTSTRIGQELVDDDHAVVLVRLDGDFPGGTVTLRYGFELRDGRIDRLAITV